MSYNLSHSKLELILIDNFKVLVVAVKAVMVTIKTQIFQMQFNDIVHNELTGDDWFLPKSLGELSK